MASAIRPGESPGPRRDETTFSRNLRYEWTSEEGRAMLGSYAISIGLAIAWLVVVHLYHPTVRPNLLPEPKAPIQVTYQDVPLPEPTPIPPAPQAGEATQVAAPGPRNLPPGKRGPTGTPRQGRPGSRTEQTSTGAIGDAFGTGSGSGSGGLVGDPTNILRGVEVNSGSGGTGGGMAGTGGGGTGGKAVLGYGQGGQGSRTPGRGGFGGGTGPGGGGGGGGIGGVGAGGGISRAAVRVSAPRVVSAGDLGGPGRDVSELGTFVRSREAQLRFCYVERGLKVNPDLAGTITVAITLTGSGSVTGANVTNRTWSGPGSSDAESCMLSRIRSWKFPSSANGGGTYSFPFNFTRG